MKSILIEKPNQLSIIEREIPTPSAGEVRVKVKLAGICGSDSHIYRGHNPFAKYPRVIGHEFFGVIDAVGDGVESARVGERVAVDPVVSCGHCYPCSIGKPNVCTTLQCTVDWLWRGRDQQQTCIFRFPCVHLRDVFSRCASLPEFRAI